MQSSITKKGRNFINSYLYEQQLIQYNSKNFDCFIEKYLHIIKKESKQQGNVDGLNIYLLFNTNLL